MKRAGESTTLQLPPEWLEFLGALKRHGVRFVIVGAHAVAAHGRPRATKDFDVLVAPSEANARKLGKALREFGFTNLGRAWRWFMEPYRVQMLGRPPLQIDILTSISGVTFAEVWRGRVSVSTDVGDVAVIGLAELRANKLAAGRPQDAVDVETIDQLVAIRAQARSRSSSRRRAARPSRTRGTAARRPRSRA